MVFGIIHKTNTKESIMDSKIILRVVIIKTPFPFVPFPLHPKEIEDEIGKLKVVTQLNNVYNKEIGIPTPYKWCIAVLWEFFHTS